MTDPQPLTAEHEAEMRAWHTEDAAHRERKPNCLICSLLATLDRDRSTPSVDGLRATTGTSNVTIRPDEPHRHVWVEVDHYGELGTGFGLCDCGDIATQSVTPTPSVDGLREALADERKPWYLRFHSADLDTGWDAARAAALAPTPRPEQP